MRDTVRPFKVTYLQLSSAQNTPKSLRGASARSSELPVTSCPLLRTPLRVHGGHSQALQSYLSPAILSDLLRKQSLLVCSILWGLLISTYMHRLDNHFNSLFPSVFFLTSVNMFVLDKVFLVKAMRYVQYSEKNAS